MVVKGGRHSLVNNFFFFAYHDCPKKKQRERERREATAGMDSKLVGSYCFFFLSFDQKNGSLSNGNACNTFTVPFFRWIYSILNGSDENLSLYLIHFIALFGGSSSIMLWPFRRNVKGDGQFKIEPEEYWPHQIKIIIFLLFDNCNWTNQRGMKGVNNQVSAYNVN